MGRYIFLKLHLGHIRCLLVYGPPLILALTTNFLYMGRGGRDGKCKKGRRGLQVLGYNYQFRGEGGGETKYKWVSNKEMVIKQW